MLNNWRFPRAPLLPGAGSSLAGVDVAGDVPSGVVFQVLKWQNDPRNAALCEEWAWCEVCGLAAEGLAREGISEDVGRLFYMQLGGETPGFEICEDCLADIIPYNSMEEM